MLDPDQDSMYPDPKHCIKELHLQIGKYGPVPVLGDQLYENNFLPVNGWVGGFKTVLWIGIHRIRIQIQIPHFKWIRTRIQGFDDQKFK